MQNLIVTSYFEYLLQGGVTVLLQNLSHNFDILTLFRMVDFYKKKYKHDWTLSSGMFLNQCCWRFIIQPETLGTNTPWKNNRIMGHKINGDIFTPNKCLFINSLRPGNVYEC